MYLLFAVASGVGDFEGDGVGLGFDLAIWADMRDLKSMAGKRGRPTKE
jgi:hypothetical protein